MEKEEIKSYIKAKSAGYQAVESIREKQLARLTPEDAMRVVVDLLSIEVDYISPSRLENSGLVILQDYFKKLAHE